MRKRGIDALTSEQAVTTGFPCTLDMPPTARNLSCCQGEPIVSAYRLSALSLLQQCDNMPSRLETTLAQYLAYSGVGVGPSERSSWRNSLPALARDLHDAGLDQIEVLVEHRLPLTSKRADAILAGLHPITGDPSYMVVELKQWSSARSWEDDERLVDVPGAPYRPSLHPSIQVGGYRDYMRDFVATLSNPNAHLSGVAYLHNATDGAVADLWQSSALEPYWVLFRPTRSRRIEL